MRKKSSEEGNLFHRIIVNTSQHNSVLQVKNHILTALNKFLLSDNPDMWLWNLTMTHRILSYQDPPKRCLKVSWAIPSEILRGEIWCQDLNMRSYKCEICSFGPWAIFLSLRPPFTPPPRHMHTAEY